MAQTPSKKTAGMSAESVKKAKTFRGTALIKLKTTLEDGSDPGHGHGG